MQVEDRCTLILGWKDFKTMDAGFQRCFFHGYAVLTDWNVAAQGTVPNFWSAKEL
jgi:hypothetical protein